MPLRRLLVPTEHGSWSFLGEPIVLGLVVAGSWAGACVALAAVAAFFARVPLRFAAADRAKGRRYARTVAAERAFALLAIAAAALFAAGVVFARGPVLLAAGAAAPIAAIALALEARGEARSAAAELLAPLALAATAAAIAIAGGWDTARAVGLWGALAARVVPTILYIRARLRLDRGERPSLAPALAAQALGVAWAAGLAAAGVAPRLAALAAAILAARAAFMLSPARPRWRTMFLGVSEIVFGALTVALIAVGALAR